MVKILPFPPPKTQSSQDTTSLPEIGYREFKTMMRQGSIGYFYDRKSGAFKPIKFLLEERERGVAQGPDRMEFHLSPLDYQYFTLAQEAGRFCIQLSSRLSGKQFNIRYDGKEFAPSLDTARLDFSKKLLGLTTMSPS